MASDRNDVLSRLSDQERCEVERYVEIFRRKGFKKHWQVNDWIGCFDSWDNFRSIRAINDHVVAKGLQGIQPKFFAIVCRLLEINDFDGSPLIKSTTY
ncbi:MAG TPA: hypothetical protein VFW33_19620 [Gemmataceae bacterium]|nr:hypothetical protein [Gemmataceae bacterium]